MCLELVNVKMLKADLYSTIKSEDSERLTAGLVGWAAREG